MLLRECREPQQREKSDEEEPLIRPFTVFISTFSPQAGRGRRCVLFGLPLAPACGERVAPFDFAQDRLRAG
ncbi:MAG: hypothetical protein DMF56_13360 [Acidobacteria bacterium]|nr:MAG: hypothetical protein DMF56_13360 [Acidobacteriota bacterium]